MTYTVKVASIEEFRGSKDAWNDLVRRMRFPSIFCTWEWIHTWWEHFGRGYYPFILFVYKKDSLKGILPLASQGAVLRGGYMTGNVLSYCGSRELYPDHLDIICSEDDMHYCMASIQKFLESHTGQWDLITIPYVLGESNLLSFLRNRTNAFRIDVRPISAAPYITLSGCFDDYIKSLKKKHRENLRNRRKKLYNDYLFKYELCDPSQHSDGFNVLFDLHKLRARKKNIHSSLANERIPDFHRALLNKISALGWASISFIKKEDQVIAASYNFIFEKTVFSYQKGIDPSWERTGPGTVLLYELINEAFSRNYKEYNFLQGSEDYKYQWTNQERALFQLTLYNNTVSGTISKVASDFKNGIKSNLNRIMKQNAD